MNNSDTSIELVFTDGLKGKVNGKGNMSLEITHFHETNRVIKITGVRPDASLIWQLIKPTTFDLRPLGLTSHRFHPMEGDLKYSLDDGIYCISGLRSLTPYCSQTFIVINEGEQKEILCVEREAILCVELKEVLEKHFPNDVAVAREARRVYKEQLAIAYEIGAEIAEKVEAQRALLEPVTDGSLTACPGFEQFDLLEAKKLMRLMKSEGFDRRAYVMQKAAPWWTAGDYPVIGSGRTPKEAFARTRSACERQRA